MGFAQEGLRKVTGRNRIRERILAGKNWDIEVTRVKNIWHSREGG